LFSRLRLNLLMPCALALALAPAAQAQAPPDFVGITSEDLLYAPGPDRSTTMNQQHSVGVRLIRQVFDWSGIEKSPGHYDFDLYDTFVRDAAAKGIAVLPVLHNPPPFYWRGSSQRPWCPPRQLSTMAEFARAAVRRYGPNGSLWRENPGAPSVPIRSWQIWNEPNLGIYWCNRPNAREYASMLRVVGKGIKSEDSGANIVTAGLPDSKLKSAMPLDKFISGLYKARGKRYFDTLAVNGYATNNAQLSELLHRVRRHMNRKRDSRAGIWITEIGWGDGGPPHRYNVGSAGQAARIANSFRLFGKLGRKLRLRGVVYYSWRDHQPYPPKYNDMWGLHTGLLDVNGNPKPAYYAFGQAAQAAVAALSR
jgi:polysaccharide biosynthesis protein PslG